MKTVFGTLILSAALMLAFAPSVPVVQAAPKSVSSKSVSPKSAGLICPVTSLPIGSPTLAVGKSVYKGKTYYFCTSNCKHLFDKNPMKYAKASK